MITHTSLGTANIMDILYPNRLALKSSPAQVIGGWALEDLEIVCRRYRFDWWVDIGEVLRQQERQP